MKDGRIETARLLLRPWQPGDAGDLFEIYREAEVMRWLGDGTAKPLTDLAQAQRAVTRRMENQNPKGLGLWAVEEKASGRVIGSCGLTPMEGGPETEISYHLGKPHWGQGFATEAAAPWLRHGLEVLHLPQVFGMAYPENPASLRVLRKIGMTYVGQEKHYGHMLEVYRAVSTP